MRLFKHIRREADKASVSPGRGARRLPRRRRARRDGAFLPQAGRRPHRLDLDHLRRHLGGHRADPGQHLQPQDPVRHLRGQEPLSGSGSDEKGINTEADLGLDPGARGLGAAPRHPHPATRRTSTRPPSSSTSAGWSNWPPTAPRRSASPSPSTSSSPATWTSGTCTCCTGKRGSGAASPVLPALEVGAARGVRGRLRMRTGRMWRARRGRITRSVWPVSNVSRVYSSFVCDQVAAGV